MQKLKKVDIKLFTKIQKKLALFEQKSNHPSLRLHKLSGGQRETWSVSVDMSYRLLFYYKQDKNQMQVVFFSFGTHDQVYK
ncbi:MAG: type II toxin-antitoxin system mRNA interferase toxin, RelE/StbE family [Candidatus Pacebacteria bacterium]|nr:type II toxin-antitoxin system mRNA interferase toxin, RelE/StbE family [Candidatus Paceibacterota bacterium]